MTIIHRLRIWLAGRIAPRGWCVVEGRVVAPYTVENSLGWRYVVGIALRPTLPGQIVEIVQNSDKWRKAT